MATNGCDVNHLDSDSLLPPRKRLLAGFKKQNSRISNGSSLPCFASSSSASADVVQAHLNNLLTSWLYDDQDEVAQGSKSAAALAVKVAKAARAAANEKAIVASKAVAAAKSALELFASFPAEAVSKSPRKNKQKKHVPVQLLYSKGIADEDLARRLNRAINNSPRVLSGHRKQKSYKGAVTTSIMYDGHDVAGVVDSDSSNDGEIHKSRVNGKLLLCDNSSLGKRRGRVKLKKLPLSMCTSKDQENGIVAPMAQLEGGSNGGVAQVRS